MGFLKKLFGGENKDQGDTNPDIDALLSSQEQKMQLLKLIIIYASFVLMAID